MKVTADTITDEQIRESMDLGDTPITGNGFVMNCRIALGEAESMPDSDAETGWRDPDENEIETARGRVASVWNARHGGES